MLFLIVGATEVTAQKKKKKAKSEPAEQPKKKNGSIKSFSEVITADAVSDAGLITTHKVDDNYYFEIPSNLLEEEILVVSRISGFVKNFSFGGAGAKTRPQQVIRFQKKDNSILVRSVSYNSVASEEDPVYNSVRNNNFEPVVYSFDIKAMKDDSSSYVIDVKPFFTTDVEMIGALRSSQRKNFKIKGLDKNRSFINYIKSFPENVEVRHILTYRGDALPDNQVTGTLSVEMNQSFILLPKDPWQPRYYDARVGYFSVRQTDYSMDEQKAASKRFITRWRLEPKDWDAYNNGELVEPVKPIIYYIDPATPEKWRKYIKQGVDDWQVAFEKAGFKNAIMGMDPPSPEEDPDWSPEDVRYSVIRYITTDIQNAQGPHVHDPRTGEILESDILWYHNVMNLLRNWYFTQTAAVREDARSYKFDDELMGELIRFVAAHEVGHTLGLPHNMGSSVAYSVDSLRSPTFTATHGTAPSIMDYARFNYIAQPEDGVENVMPMVGEYDFWSIIYGYKLIPDADSPEAEKETLNNWIKERAGNPEYRFGRQRRNNFDPSAQTEDLGDDAVYASELGIKNLKRIVPNLIEYSSDENKNYDDLEEMYGQVIGQMRRYVGHVGTNIGGVYEYMKNSDEEGAVYTHVSKQMQQKAVNFMNEQVFTTPDWLLNKEIISRISEQGTLDRIKRMQVQGLNTMYQPDRLKRMMENEVLNGTNAYKMVDLFEDTRKGIFSELRSSRSIDPLRRNIQKEYVAKMKDLMILEDDEYQISDIQSVARGNLTALKSSLTSSRTRFTDTTSRYHVEDLIARIDEILDED